MSADSPQRAHARFGLGATTLARLRGALEASPGIRRVWIFGSRAKGLEHDGSDVDLAVDAPGWSSTDMSRLLARLEATGTLHKLDVVHWQAVSEPVFRQQIERDRVEFWAPTRYVVHAEAVGGIALKPFQAAVLEQLARYVAELKRHRQRSEDAMQALREREGLADMARELADFPRKTWDALRAEQRLPAAFAGHAHQSRFDGAGHAIPNVCLKVPTGGGKTLLAAAAVAQLMQAYLGRTHGLVLWIVPNEAIYRQTLAALSHRDHPYRQMLNVAAAGRVKVLEKLTPLTRQDVDSHLCVMLLMLQSAARQSKETLKLFRDRGNVLGFLPREDDAPAHWELLKQVPNLDVYAPWSASASEAAAQMGSIVKSSLGNVMRLVRPIVVMDEGHHAYTENAMKTLDGFNPSFLLELSATPRIASAKGSGSNILANVRGTDLDEAEMIKLPIQVDVRGWTDWQSCLGASLEQLDALQRSAVVLQGQTARYIRPLMLVQVERTGNDLRDSGFIHAEDAKAHLLRLGLTERQIAIKTSERNDLASPENIDLLSPACEVRVIITKQALQEGWDCPFAYVLCALAAGRNLAAMTQLVGRILRMPHVAKTGHSDLDACYVLCHDAETGRVVQAIKKSLEDEGMGDLGVVVRGSSDGSAAASEIVQTRRPPWHGRRIFVPQVTWVLPEGGRRTLVYESDVLAALPWERLDVGGLAATWAPSPTQSAPSHLSIGLGVLKGEADAIAADEMEIPEAVDAARLVRALSDLAPNPWHVWAWVESTLARLRGAGFKEEALARSTLSLIETLRVDLQKARDELAEQVFARLLADGQIEFRLRADTADYEMPQELRTEATQRPLPLTRPQDLKLVEKSLYEPALRWPDMNEFEVKVAGYLDQQAAVRWWHRNVARAQVGLQGWRKGKVYPDFIFASTIAEGATRLVLLETKGLHLRNEDSAYKASLLDMLSRNYRDERWQKIGSLELGGGAAEEFVCDLVYQPGWEGELSARHFQV
jgi:type III restriction enzyme